MLIIGLNSGCVSAEVEAVIFFEVSSVRFVKLIRARLVLPHPTFLQQSLLSFDSELSEEAEDPLALLEVLLSTLQQSQVRWFVDRVLKHRVVVVVGELVNLFPPLPQNPSS